MSGKRIAWTPEEDKELRRIYAMVTAGQSSRALAELAKRKSTSRQNCRHRACILGVSRFAGAKRRWTETELENLKYYAGRLPASKIARILGRSHEAIVSRLHLLALSGRVKERGYERRELADLLGVDQQDTLKRLLRRFPIPANLLGNFAEEDVQSWLWDHLEDLELRKINQAWFKSMIRSFHEPSTPKPGAHHAYL